MGAPRRLLKHKMGAWPHGATSSFTPPADVYLQHTNSGGGADNRVNLANWLSRSQVTTALNANDYLGAANSANTVTAAAGNSAKVCTSGLLDNAGLQTFGAAFKAGTGMSAVGLFSGVSNANYATFDLNTSAVVNGGTAVGTIHDLGGGWYWCSVLFASPLSSFDTVKFTTADTAAHAVPGTAWNSTGAETLFAGPFAGT